MGEETREAAKIGEWSGQAKIGESELLP